MLGYFIIGSNSILKFEFDSFNVADMNTQTFEFMILADTHHKTPFIVFMTLYSSSPLNTPAALPLLLKIFQCLERLLFKV